ncbi:hypothetical protein BDY19DRAFT_997115 [Irpex rosettiformis]|uniref:Uncharacterized protein n=1 Tax=Irpex rosettiformis TaxID=378272 RepID=A0ACB8TSZ7_9APHY|nr:hypothetical protein BDY19DRAFT_997115 [Irpex rosettiformis]
MVFTSLATLHLPPPLHRPRCFPPSKILKLSRLRAPSTNGDYLDSTRVKNLERKEILKLAQRCGSNTIHIIRHLLIKYPRGVRSRWSKWEPDSSVLTAGETEFTARFEAIEEEDFSTVGRQMDESSSVIASEGIEERRNPPRMIYRETEYGFVAEEIRFVEDAGSYLMPVIFTDGNYGPTNTVSEWEGSISGSPRQKMTQRPTSSVYC